MEIRDKTIIHFPYPPSIILTIVCECGVLYYFLPTQHGSAATPFEGEAEWWCCYSNNTAHLNIRSLKRSIKIEFQGIEESRMAASNY